MERTTRVDMRFGFPVVLENVETRTVRGEPVVMVNSKALREAVLAALVVKQTTLTGSELRFVRLSFEKSTVELAADLGVTHAAVIGWEKKGAKPTRMARGTEFLVRFLILEGLPSDLQRQLFPEPPDFTRLREQLFVTASGSEGVSIDSSLLAA